MSTRCSINFEANKAAIIVLYLIHDNTLLTVHTMCIRVKNIYISEYFNQQNVFKTYDTTVRVPTFTGKPGKMRVHLENLEKSWNFAKNNKNHGKITWNLEKYLVRL